MGRPAKPFDYYVEKTDTCWLWRGCRNPEGYGMFVRVKVGSKRYFMAHRWAWIQANGPIPVDYVIDHLCHVSSCVNPNHLEAVTQQVNTLRGNGPAAANARKTHCVEGHPLIKNPSGPGRFCRVCRRKQWAAWARAKRDAVRRSEGRLA